MSGADKDSPEKSVQDFLQRWSRRKLGIAETADAAPPAPEPPQTGELQSVPPRAEVPAAPPAEVDLESLPPIDSIDATTDIRAFLAPGVPVELTRAALRRAWTSDPVIRGFVGIAENQWDFTNPEGVPGFGSLELTEDVRAMVSRLFGEVQAEASQEAAENSGDTRVADSGEPAVISPRVSDRNSLSADAAVTRAVAGSDDAAGHPASQNEPDIQDKRQPVERKHGAALPK